MQFSRPGPLTPRRFWFWLLLLGLALCLCLILGASFGAGGNYLSNLWHQLDERQNLIFFQIRLPRVLLAALLGAALTAAGVAFQAMLRNPLADPYILGVSGGASIGGVLAMLLGVSALLGPLSGMGVPMFAFLGALGALFLIEWIATVDGRLTVYTVLLSGAIFNAFSGALIYFIQSMASMEELHAIVFYLMGRIPTYNYTTLTVVALFVLMGTGWLVTSSRAYNALSFGEEGAAQLGIDVERLKRKTFLVGSLLTGLAVSLGGMIGFVGLVVPHLLRLLLGPDHRLLLPAAILGGAAFLVLADLLARTIAAPSEIPIGVITALTGGPFFLVLLRRRGGSHGF